MQGLIHDFFLALARFGFRTDRNLRKERRHVDFVEGQPIVDFPLIAFKQCCRISFKEADQFAVFPAAVVVDQILRHFEMRDRHQWFDAIFRQFIEDVIVKGQAGFVRFQFITIRKNPRPGDRHPEHPEAHFGEQSDIFLVAVIEIDTGVRRVVVTNAGKAFSKVARAGQLVDDRWTFPISVPTSFKLIGGCSAAPEETFRKSFTC